MNGRMPCAMVAVLSTLTMGLPATDSARGLGPRMAGSAERTEPRQTADRGGRAQQTQAPGGGGRAAIGGVTATVITLPPVPGANAIWGSTGQDSRGHIWFGISTGGVDPKSAHLIEYLPESNRPIDRGNVVDELRRAGLLRAGEQQAKIHSRIVELGGFLYFASMDEDGEDENGSRPPTWGGHLWRLNLATGAWQHLLRAPEALIAVAAGGRYVYTLGYFGHVLYQYDTQSGRTARARIGSIDGHITRNFVVDDRGHAFVPRLTREAAGAGAPQIRVALVELGPALAEIKSTPIDAADYLGRESPTGAHGIIGVQRMADGSVAFTTHAGRLFRVVPPAARAASSPGTNRGAAPAADTNRAATSATQGAAAELVNLGMIHPRGTSYPSSLFTTDGRSTLSTMTQAGDSRQWEWVVCEWPSIRCRATPLEVPGLDSGTTSRLLLYGSSTRDAAGGHYVVGMGPGYKPIVLRLAVSR